MTAIKGLLHLLAAVNSFLLRIGRFIAGIAIGVMVIIILIQVFFRYILGNALPWPDEAARFLMLWMTGLIAPTAYRNGGFVSIDMVTEAMPRRIGELVILFLLIVAMGVLMYGVSAGYTHVNSGWLFASSSLKIPLGLIGMQTVAIKLAWMYMSLAIGLFLLTLVNIELILRAIAHMADPDWTPPETDGVLIRAE